MIHIRKHGFIVAFKFGFSGLKWAVIASEMRQSRVGLVLSVQVVSPLDVDVVDLRAQADASMPTSNNNFNYTIYSNF